MKRRFLIYTSILFLLILVLVCGNDISYSVKSEEPFGDSFRKQVKDAVNLTSAWGDYYHTKATYRIKEVLGKGSTIDVRFTSHNYKIYCNLYSLEDTKDSCVASGYRKQGSLFFEVDRGNTYCVQFFLCGLSIQSEMPLNYSEGIDYSYVDYHYETEVNFTVKFHIQDTHIVTTIRTPFDSPYTPLLIVSVLAISLIDGVHFVRRNRAQKLVSERVTVVSPNSYQNQSESVVVLAKAKTLSERPFYCNICYHIILKEDIFCYSCGSQLFQFTQP